ncbi:MAG TPA: GNAT family N-acetyltransferase [Micrococcales bacterium]|uniref:N-acetyltransferase n=1 Tax=Miniimonas arenae TaxID=676201 RepID=A0A5C5B9D4_9MICO|nr:MULTISPECIES: GNAT family N-acetyltransferase [Miniimonas]TNU73129.1 N-acetyltransferase [Miniimonas arenae]HCX86186.1 GNAT family N-acetyltransferase [Micrococcales bacterium]
MTSDAPRTQGPDPDGPPTEVLLRPERSRYEILVGGRLAGIAAFTEIDGVTVFTHTVVQDEFEGQGYASAMVDGAIADVVARGGRFAAICPYVRHWLTKFHQHDAALAPLPTAVAGGRLLD